MFLQPMDSLICGCLWEDKSRLYTLMINVLCLLTLDSHSRAFHFMLSVFIISFFFAFTQSVVFCTLVEHPSLCGLSLILLSATMESSSRCKEVVLLACGSFNPITNMHLRMFELARDYLHETGKYMVIKGIISPVSDAYKKKGLVETRHRVAMIEKAVQYSDWVTVDPWESKQGEWLETVKVLRHHYENLMKLYGNDKKISTLPRKAKKRKAEDKDICPLVERHDFKPDLPELMLLCGADVLESFGVPNLWKKEDLEEILGRFGLVCISRQTCNLQKCIYESDLIWRFREKIHLVTEWIDNDISATKVRRALRRGQSVRYVIPDPVIEYIQQHRLYDQHSEAKNSDVVLAPLQRYGEESSGGSLQC
ncbi:nicotinamide/nicotinic acid mononucleotide adenylyltransferase 1 isoform X1 [Mobula birostris]|uniref:nicotinamide/nicotinic acid mononucleotide adenylyltransferase 1 isoform X1 n=2 Tax=Mobula birostris TaxID=1983395 RepID=UPI003B287AB2